MMILWSEGISAWIKRAKADPVLLAGRQQCHKRYGEHMTHHRGLRAGHESKGTVQEPGRSKYLLVEKRRYQEVRPEGEIPASMGKPRSIGEFHDQWKTQTEKKGKARYRGDSE